MVSRELEVINESGIHARPAAAIVEMASKFNCEIVFVKDEIRANAKSIMNVLLLAAEPGSRVVIEADGDDENEALQAMESLFQTKFHHEKK